MTEVTQKNLISNTPTLYDEFTFLEFSSYSDRELVKDLIETLGEEFWGILLEMDSVRQALILQTLAENQDLVSNLLKKSTKNFIVALVNLPEEFMSDLKDSFVEAARGLPPGDARRLIIAEIFQNGKFLEPAELKDLAWRVADFDLEPIFSTLSAEQILVLAKALPPEVLASLPEVIKRATVLAQIKSVICAETEADPKLKQVCTRGKWAAIRTFGAKIPNFKSEIRNNVK